MDSIICILYIILLYWAYILVKVAVVVEKKKKNRTSTLEIKRALLAVLRWCQVPITPPPRSVHWSIIEAKFVHKNVIGLTQRHCTHTAALAPSLYSPVFGGRELSDRQQYNVNGSSLYPSKTKASANRLTGYASRLTSGRYLERCLDLPSLRLQKKRRFPSRDLYLFLCFQWVKIITATYITGTLFIVFVRIHKKTG